MKYAGHKRRRRARALQTVVRRAAPRRKAALSLRKASNRRTGGLLGIEVKYYDSHLNDSNIAASDSTTLGVKDPVNINTLFAPVPGNGPTNREGNKVLMKRIDITGTLEIESNLLNGVPLIAPPKVFLALVLDTQSNGAQLASEAVYQNTPASFSSRAFLVRRNMSNTTRFRVLRTFTHIFQPITSVSMDSADTARVYRPFTACQFEMHAKLNIPVHFVSGSTDENVTAITDNSLHLIAFSIHPGTSQVALNYACRVRFVG